MYTKGFGEVLALAMTVNPAIGSIPSASAILDASNFTFNAVTFGKDAEGFKQHSHAVSSFNGSVYNSGVLLIRRYNSLHPSSYHSSATHLAFSSTYNSIPSYPSPYDTRLERNPNLYNISGVPDLGHYINAAIDSSLSAYWNVVGGFAPSGNTARYHFCNSAGTFQFSGLLSGMFNNRGLMDKNGFLKIFEANASATTPASVSGGPFLNVNTATFSSTPYLNLAIVLQLGDAATLAAFGGLNHVGIWCLDLEEMLASGLVPPYSWNHLNNTRKYKLVAKITSWDDILYHEDATDPNLQILYTFSSKSYAGFKTLLEQGFNDITTNQGPGMVLQFRFI